MKNIKYVVYREDKYYVAQCLNVDVSSFGRHSTPRWPDDIEVVVIRDIGFIIICSYPEFPDN